jgi:hypothetical protein
VPREIPLLRKETGEETDIFRNLVSTRERADLTATCSGGRS